MRVAFAVLILLAGCAAQPQHQTEILGELQKEHGSDKITVVKWFNAVDDKACDLSGDDYRIEKLKKSVPFTATRLQYRVANKTGQQELHDELIVIGKNQWSNWDVSTIDPGEPTHKILEKL